MPRARHGVTLGSAATCTAESPRGTHARRTQEVAHLCSPVFSYRTSPEIDEGLYLRRGTSYGLTSCVFRVMPRDLIVLLIINRERRYTSRSRETAERMPVAAAAAATYGGRCVTPLSYTVAFLVSIYFGVRSIVIL